LKELNPDSSNLINFLGNLCSYTNLEFYEATLITFKVN
jgi:hypothetical protein